VNSNTEKKNFTGVQNYPDLDLHDGTKPMDAKYLFPDKYQLLMELWGIKNHGGTKGGINYFHYNNFVIFQCIEFNFESGLRTMYPVHPRSGKSKKNFKIKMQADFIILHRPCASVAIQTPLGGIVGGILTSIRNVPPK